jgi:hypothetical protein
MWSGFSPRLVLLITSALAAVHFVLQYLALWQSTGSRGPTAARLGLATSE